MSATRDWTWYLLAPPKDGRIIVIVGQQSTDAVPLVASVYWCPERSAWRESDSGEVLDDLAIDFWVPYPGDTTPLPAGHPDGDVRLLRLTDSECGVIWTALKTLKLATDGTHNSEIDMLAPIFKPEAAR